MIKECERYKEMPIDEFRENIFMRFVVLTDRFADYLKNSGEMLETLYKSNCFNGKGWVEVVYRFGVHRGELMENANYIKYIAFPEVIGDSTINFNPDTPYDLLKMCNQIIAALKPLIYQVGHL